MLTSHPYIQGISARGTGPRKAPKEAIRRRRRQTAHEQAPRRKRPAKHGPAVGGGSGQVSRHCWLCFDMYIGDLCPRRTGAWARALRCCEGMILSSVSFDGSTARRGIGARECWRAGPTRRKNSVKRFASPACAIFDYEQNGDLGRAAGSVRAPGACQRGSARAGLRPWWWARQAWSRNREDAQPFVSSHE